MKRALALLILLLLPALLAAEAKDAVVRIISHGCSGTVIHTAEGKTLILTCAHAFKGRDRYKKLTVDAPHPRPGAVSTGGIRVLKVDYNLDLCLLEMRTGPLPYVCPVARAGHRPRRYLSVGYDEMRHQVTVRSATLLREMGKETWTREPPWHGRSGGALLDPDSRVLLGTVIGYQSYPRGPGVYSSHSAILTFLGYSQAPRQRQPLVEESREPYFRPDGRGPGAIGPVGGFPPPGGT